MGGASGQGRTGGALRRLPHGARARANGGNGAHMGAPALARAGNGYGRRCARGDGLNSEVRGD
ncbi:MAG: hypothetical protein LBL83_13070 [Clostridiales bacterium]|nr:hypothetical protein [Clostridiales bacterium]